MTPMIGTMVASASPPSRSDAVWSSAPARPRTTTEIAMSNSGSAPRMRARRRPSRARYVSRATVGSYIFGLLRRDQVREHGLEGLVGRRDREQSDAVVPGDPWQQCGEAAEVDGLDAQRSLGEVDLDAGGRRVGDQRGRERAVVAGAHEVAVRAVGHQPADLAEVAAGRVAP